MWHGRLARVAGTYKKQTRASRPCHESILETRAGRPCHGSPLAQADDKLKFVEHSSGIYQSGEYLDKNPTYHVEDSAWKARQIFQMIEKNRVKPASVCEVGCGAGEILKQLQA